MWKLSPMWTSSKPLKVCYLKTSTHKTEEEESCTPTLAPCRNCNVSLRRFLLKCEVLFVSETHYWECERVRKWGLVVNWQATPVNAISWQNVIHWHSCYLSSYWACCHLLDINCHQCISAGCHLFRLVLKLLSGGNLGYLELTWSFAFGEPEERIISRGAFQEGPTWLTVELICLIYTALSVAAESLTVSYQTRIHITQEMKTNLQDRCIRI